MGEFSLFEIVIAFISNQNWSILDKKIKNLLRFCIKTSELSVVVFVVPKLVLRNELVLGLMSCVPCVFRNRD